MDPQQEYFSRRKIKGLVRYQEYANVMLSSNGELYNLTIQKMAEANHPAQFYIQLAAAPVIYASADFNHVSTSLAAKSFFEEKWEWDVYEKNLVNWIGKNKGKYKPIKSEDALMFCWTSFLRSYDLWIAHFVPIKVLSQIASSLSGDKKIQAESVKTVENWLKERHEKIATCWKNIKSKVDSKNYADWLADLF